MPLECGTIVGIESRESRIGKLRPQQSNEVESRDAPANPEDLAHQALRPVTANRTPYSARCDDSQPAAIETVGKREQGQVAAPDADTLPLNAEELPAPPNPVVPRQCAIHAPRRRECPRRAVASDPSRHGKTLSPLRPTPSQDLPAGLRAHSLAKPVRSLAPPIVWLVRALHALVIPVNVRGHPDEPTAYQTNIIAGRSISSQRSPAAACAPFHELIPIVVTRERVVHSPSPAAQMSPPARFPQGVEETVEIRVIVRCRSVDRRNGGMHREIPFRSWQGIRRRTSACRLGTAATTAD